MNMTGGNHPPGMPHGFGPAPPGVFKGGDMGSMPPHGPMPPHGAMPPMPKGPRPPLPFDDGTVGPHGGPRGGPHGGGGPHRRMLRGVDAEA